MTNGEKYHSVKERLYAFAEFCNGKKGCYKCEIGDINRKAHDGYVCPFAWLELDAKEKPMNCPHCGGECAVKEIDGDVFVVCTKCLYRYGNNMSEDDTVAEHNRVCKAVNSCRKES